MEEKSLLVSKKKFYATLINIIVLVFEAVISAILMNHSNTSSVQDIRIASLICIFAFFVCIVLWYYLEKEIICTYVFFFCCLFIFSCGQSLGWGLGFDMGGKDLIDRVDYGLNKTLLLKGLCYSMMAFTTFNLGAIISNHSIKRFTWSAEDVTNAFENIGRLMLIIAIPSFILNIGETIFVVMNGGYHASYDLMVERSSIMKVIRYMGEYMQPCLLLIVVANRNKSATKRNMAVFMLIIGAICKLYIGGRNQAVLTMMGIILAFHYFVKKFNISTIVKLGIGGYFGLAILNAVAQTRNIVGHSLVTFISNIDLNPGSVIGEFVGEMGWSISSVCWTMNYVPSVKDYMRGTSYLMAPLNIIPNLGFWKVHPALKYDVGEWLQSITHASYGLGYTMPAESYINFGWYGGIAFMFVWGVIIAKLFARVKRKDVDKDLLGATMQIILFMTLTKVFVRSTFSASMRSIAYVLFPVYLIMYIALQKYTKQKNLR